MSRQAVDRWVKGGPINDNNREHLLEFRTDDQMSLAEYLATVPLFFDYLTYRVDDVVGLEPPPPA